MKKLVAMNDQGASVVFTGNSQREVLYKFDSAYYRSGWQIHIENEEGIIIKIIRNTFRKSNFHILHNGHK